MQFPSHDGRAFGALLVALSWVASGCFDAAKPDPAETVAVAQFETTTVAIDTVGSPDLPPLEVAGKPDGTVLECPGGPGCACVAHTECQTGLCLDDPNNPTGKACARKCVDVCPDGYACAPVTGSGGDISTICVPKLGHLCDPCATSKDCEALGLKDSACVDEGPLGNFCGIACSADADCPKAYSCKEITTAEGGKLKQCVFAIEGGSAPFGQCSCSTVAVQKKLATACYIPIKDAAGKESGKCVGSRACLAEGLSACTALAASAELCDGKDNDCDGATDEAACDDNNACTADVCDPAASGAKCIHTSQTGVACDGDNSVCTEGDTCQAGKCVVGKAKDCDDKNLCTQDSCDLAKGCTHVVDDGKPCDADGNLCTQGDVCQGGTCKQGGQANCDDANPCTSDGCDKKTGQCTAVELDDGVPCDDGTKCTAGDVCKSGACKGKPIACADDNPCTADVCDAKAGCQLQKLTGAPCDDDNLCTIGDQCSDGDCLPGKVKACLSPDGCYLAKCGLLDGKCKITEAPTGISCDDGNACTSGDSCTSGNCTGIIKGCDDGDPCTEDSCTLKLGCTTSPATKPCDDGNACTDFDSCKAGACVGLPKTATVACDDANPCTSDGCDAKAGCVHSPLTGNCDDGNSCTQGDVCQSGVCSGGSNACACQADSDCASQEDGDLCNGTLFCDKAKLPYVCKVKASSVVGCDTSKDGPCALTACVAKSGACGKVAVGDGKACDADGSVCSQSDACQQGTCAAGAKVVCDDSNSCTTDSCDAKTGCVFAANSQSCNADGDACTAGDGCKDKVCLAGVKKVCDDGEVCTVDSCDKLSGLCAFAGKGQDGAGCDADGSVCTVSDSCSGGKCLTDKAKSCDDGNPCTDDSCDAKLGCKSAANAKGCDDGNPCTAGDVCGQAVCAGVPLNVQAACDDYNPCTSDGCDVKLGCVHSANKLQCDDGNPCTVGDACVDKACTSGTNTCGCEADSGCAGQEDGDLCNGTLFCDKAKLPYVCKVNVKTVVVCDASKDSACLSTVCTAKTGACDKVAAVAGKACDADGSVCTEGDACKAGACVAGAGKGCDDGNACTNDGCDAKSGCVHLANAASCSDGNACTSADACVAGDCEGKQVSCDDGNPCTDQVCEKATGCKWVPNQVVCDDGNACTVGDVCAVAKCVGKVVSCDDGDPCTADGCDAVKGCGVTVVAEKTACAADGSLWCVGGKCVGKAVCGDGATLPCTVYSNSFDCTSPIDFQIDVPAPQVGGQARKVVWAVDQTPVVQDQAKYGCTLNFNNGTNYCDLYYGNCQLPMGTATSPPFDFSTLPSAILPSLTMDIYYDVDVEPGATGQVLGYDAPKVILREVTTGATLASWVLPTTNADIKTWKAAYKIDMPQAKGSKVTLEFLINLPGNALVDQKNLGAGVFIDNVKVQVAQFPNCWSLLAAVPTTPDGLYSIDPDGPGGIAPFQAYCDMTTDGGGWTQLTENVAKGLKPSSEKEYLYTVNASPKRWYRSPKTNLMWSWSAGQELPGSYAWSNGIQSGALTCSGSAEKPKFGIGCSNGAGNTAKCIADFATDPLVATATVCQDTPNAFGGLVCQVGVAIWVR